MTPPSNTTPPSGGADEEIAYTADADDADAGTQASEPAAAGESLKPDNAKPKSEGQAGESLKPDNGKPAENDAADPDPETSGPDSPPAEEPPKKKGKKAKSESNAGRKSYETQIAEAEGQPGVVFLSINGLHAEVANILTGVFNRELASRWSIVAPPAPYIAPGGKMNTVALLKFAPH